MKLLNRISFVICFALFLYFLLFFLGSAGLFSLQIDFFTEATLIAVLALIFVEISFATM